MHGAVRGNASKAARSVLRGARGALPQAEKDNKDNTRHHRRMRPFYYACGVSDPLERLKKDLRHFAAERGWERYHTPKNVAMALSVEAAELAEIFQWLTPAQSRRLPPAKKVHAGEEVADVLLYLVRLADLCGIDVLAAARDKMKKNAVKYPPGTKGRSRLA